MLQIITGKFYENGEIRHNACNGVLYSNIIPPVVESIHLGSLEIRGVDWNPGFPTYVVSYDNQLEVRPGTEMLVKVGDNIVIEQLGYILSFALNGIFDVRESHVKELCETGKAWEAYPSSFVKTTFDMNRYSTLEDWDFCKQFYLKLMGLPRKEYNIVMKCLAAYNSSFKVFYNDISLAYSIMIYVLETLSGHFDGYIADWDDYPSDKRFKLEKELNKIDREIANNIRDILISESHLRLSKRFSEFILKYVDREYYTATDTRQITEDELKQSVANAYTIRSKYAHELQPIMKQLKNGSSSKKSEIFTWYHDTYFTYSGLLRLVRTVITNFVNSRENVMKEDYPWHKELPGIIEIELSPELGYGKSVDLHFKQVANNFSTLFEFTESKKEIPNLNGLVKNYSSNLPQIKEKERDMAYVLCWIYINRVKGVSLDFIENTREKIESYNILMNKCTMATLIGSLFGMQIGEFELSEVEQCINDYNKNKFKKNRLKLCSRIENKLYYMVAKSYESEGNSNSALIWYTKLYKNAVNDIDIQKVANQEITNLTTKE